MKGKATMESIIQLYEQGELHQHYQRLRNGSDINRATFFHVLISRGIIDESLEYLISCAIGALNRAEALALRELYKSSSSREAFLK